MAKAKALQWIIREAKRLQREYPNRFEKWTEYVAQASAIYSAKHKGHSPVGHKHKKKSMPAKRKKHYGPVARKRKSAKRITGSGISTKSRTHTDHNRQRTYITIGSVKKDKKRASEKVLHLIGQEDAKLFLTRLKKGKKRIAKKIAKKLTHLKREYRRLTC